MHTLVLHCVNQYTKFEMLSFFNSKGMIGAKLKILPGQSQLGTE